MAAPEGEAIHLLAVAAATKRLSLPDFRGEGGGLGSQKLQMRCAAVEDICELSEYWICNEYVVISGSNSNK